MPEIPLIIRRAKPHEEQFVKDFQYLINNLDNWTDEFGPDKWVAVYQGKRVALSENMEEMFEQVTAQNLPPNLVAFAKLNDLITTTS